MEKMEAASGTEKKKPWKLQRHGSESLLEGRLVPPLVAWQWLRKAFDGTGGSLHFTGR